MDQLFCMRAFKRVVELRSFAKAAEDLDVARPTVSNAVAQLEKRLGVRLLHRTTRRLNITQDGQAYYEGCVRILHELAETEDQLSNARRSPRGRLRVSTPNSFVQLRFMEALPEFLARYPDIELEVVMTNRAVDLVEEGVDCAVRAVDIPGDSTLIARHIADVRWITCASPGYLARAKPPRDIADLERHECVRFISPSTGRAADWHFEHGKRRVSYTPKGRLGVTSMEAAGAAALHGIGIAQVPESLVYPHLRSGALAAVLLEWAAPAPALKVVYPSNRYLTAKVRVFADFIAEIFPREGWWPEIAVMRRRQRPAARRPR